MARPPWKYAVAPPRPRPDPPIPRQGVEEGRPAVGQRRPEQVEVGRVVQRAQQLVGVQPLGGAAVLERHPVEQAPEGALLLGEVPQLLLRGADPDVLDAGEGDRPPRDPAHDGGRATLWRQPPAVRGPRSDTGDHPAWARVRACEDIFTGSQNTSIPNSGVSVSSAAL
jgi:hypothetical protein